MALRLILVLSCEWVCSADTFVSGDLQEINAPYSVLETVKQAQAGSDISPKYAPLYSMMRMRDRPLNTPRCALYVVYVLRQVTNKAMRSPTMPNAVVARFTS